MIGLAVQPFDWEQVGLRTLSFLDHVDRISPAERKKQTQGARSALGELKTSYTEFGALCGRDNAQLLHLRLLRASNSPDLPKSFGSMNLWPSPNRLSSFQQHATHRLLMQLRNIADRTGKARTVYMFSKSSWFLPRSKQVQSTCSENRKS